MADPVNLANAISAYGKAAKGGASAGLDSRDAQPDGQFAQVLENSLRSAVNQSRKAENLSMAAVAGKADLNDVITAVAEAELTIQTVVNVRDKVIEAYKEILRMPV